MSRLHVHLLQSWWCYYKPRETYRRNWRWAAANCCAPTTNQATCLSTWISHNIRFFLMSFCWPKTTPIAAPIKSFTLKTAWARIFAVCILKLNAEPLGSLNDGHSTLADLLIYCRMCRGQIHSPPIGGKHDRTRLFLPPFMLAWDDFLPVEKQTGHDV